jgi:hypothetical protein
MLAFGNTELRMSENLPYVNVTLRVSDSLFAFRFCFVLIWLHNQRQSRIPHRVIVCPSTIRSQLIRSPRINIELDLQWIGNSGEK